MPWMDDGAALIRRLLGSPSIRSADDYDTMARQYAGALLSGDEAEAARLANMLGTAKVQGEFVPPTEADLLTMAERFPADQSIIGGPVKTVGQSRALSRRPDVGGLSATDDLTLEDAIALQQALDQGAMVRGTMNTAEPALTSGGNIRDDLMEFFGTKAQKQRAGLDPEMMATRGDVDAPIIDAIRQDQLLGIAAQRAADEAAAIDALDEAGPMFPLREARTGTDSSTSEDIAKLSGGGALAGGLAYALSQMGSPDEETVVMSQEVADGEVGDGDDPLDLAAAAEAASASDDAADMIPDIGDGDPADGMATPAGRVMGPDDLAAFGLNLVQPDVLEDGPSDTADLVAESRPIPDSTPVAVKRTTVIRRPVRTSRGRRKPNYGYSRAMNPSQRGRRR